MALGRAVGYCLLPHPVLIMRNSLAGWHISPRNIAVFLFVVTTSSCDLVSTQPAPDPIALPLTVGTRWTYQVTPTVSLGAPVASSTLVMTVLKDTVVGSLRGVTINTGSELFDGAGGSFAIRNDPAGLKMVPTSALLTLFAPDWILMLNYPARVGSGP